MITRLLSPRHRCGTGYFRTIVLATSAFVSPMLSGCASLPSNGPTASAITHGAMDGSELQYQVEDIVSADSTIFDVVPQPLMPGLLASVGVGQIQRDALQPGDVLQIRIYEIGISLFSGPPSTGAGGMSNDLTAHSEVFENIIVDEEGMVTLPYLGRVHIAGSSINEAEIRLRSAMRGRSQSADIVINRTESPGTNFAIAGNVRRPGLFPVSPATRTLLDALLVAGGEIEPSYDEIVRFTRNSVTRTTRLSEINPADPSYNIAMAAGDRVEVLHDPLTFLSLGAGGKVAQIPFDTEHLTLAEAIAKLGGPNDNQANPRAIFLFRKNPALKPGDPITVYRLDMIRPTSYILAQQIEMNDKDVIFIANASANLPTKFVSILNQLFSPFVTLRAVSQ